MSGPGPEDAPLQERGERQQDERHSVLAELPRTRPQRPSRRRETARARATRVAETPAQAASAAPDASAAKAGRAATSKTAASRAATSKTAASRAAGPKRRAPQPAKRVTRTPPATTTTPPPTPSQGYEADSDLTGTPVTPPTGTEMIGALAELAGELAQTGISAGGRLLRGALSRLAGS